MASNESADDRQSLDSDAPRCESKEENKKTTSTALLDRNLLIGRNKRNGILPLILAQHAAQFVPCILPIMDEILELSFLVKLRIN
jgi:hypothetical protein